MIRRGFRSKFLSILLIITLLIGMGSMNSFAMEGDEIPTEDEIILEDGIVPEVIETENVEEDLEDRGLEENLEQEIQDLVAPQSDEVLLESNIIEVGTFEQLEGALGTIKDGGTIKLLNSIDYNKGIVIDSKTVTFDVYSYTLDVTNTLTGNTHGVGLEVKNGGHVNLVGTGQLNITTINGAASSDGVVVRGNSSAMVTNVKTISGSGNGVYADGDGAVIQVLGNIEAEGSSSCVARTWGSGSITIDGTVAKGLYYVRIHNYLGEVEGVPDSVKPGYLKYSIEGYPGTVWIKGALPVDDNVCAIGDKKYETLDKALGEVKTGETIQLLKSIDYDKGIEIDNKEIVFDVGSYTLNVVNESGTGLKVLYGGQVALVGTGQFNVTGAGYGVYVDSGRDKSPTKATVTNATVTSMAADKFYGVYAFNIGSEIVVLKDVKATGNKGVGVRAYEGGAITVNGNVEGSKTGAVAEGDLGISVITIKGNVTSTANEGDVYTTPHGVYVQRSGEVTVSGKVLATGNGSIGTQTYGSGEIKVTGNVQGQKLGAGASGGSIVIGGDAIGGVDGTGAITESRGSIIIDGNAIGGSYGVVARTGNITIKKDAKGTTHGVYARGDNSIVTVYGSVTAIENEAAFAYTNAKISIKGDAISENPSGGYSGYGAHAYDHSTIEVEGDVKGLEGAFSDKGSEISIGGNAISTANATSDVASVAALNNSSVILLGNTSGGQYGARTINGGNITIDGWINQVMYINLDSYHKNIDDYEPITTKAGYRTYTEETNTVWVKIAEADIVAPTWPNDSTITSVYTSSTTLNLIWPEAEDNVGVDKYLIYTVTYTEEGIEEKTLIGEVNSNNDREFEVNDLDPDTEYRIRITAVDKAGNMSEGSLEKTFKTKKAFTVTFDSQGGTLVDNQIITEGETVINPITTRAGFTFGGWFKDSECLNPWNFDTDTITGDITLYAKWKEGEIKPPATPVVTTNLPATKSVIKGKTVTLTVNANVSDGGTLSYQWYKDGIAIVGANTNFLTITNASSSDNGNYKVIITNTKDGISSIVESTLCALTINSSSGGGDNNDHTPIDKDKKKDKNIEKPKEIINDIIILDIDQDILDENTLVPYYINNKDDMIVKLSAIFNGKMHLIGNSNTDYPLKDNMKYFTDILNHWAKNDIDFITAREFFHGTGTDEFGPDIPITRAMFATTLGKLWGVDISLYKTSRFIDVKIDKSYTPYVEWAAENGIVNGIGNNYFGPEKLITREEIAVMITSFINYTNLTLNEDDAIIPTFADYNTISEWAKESVRTIQNSGIICGKPGNIFDPKGMTTRAEAAVILKRLIIDMVK